MVGQDSTGRVSALPIDKKPSVYVDDTYRYFERRLQELEDQGGKK